MKSVFIFTASIICSVVLSLLWWKGWMYDGLMRPPRFLLPFSGADGESIDDVVLLEMFVIVQAAILALLFAFRKKVFKSPRNSEST